MPVTALPEQMGPAVPELSQYALSRLDQCERLFELGHLQRVVWPAPDPLDDRPDVRARLSLGDIFHRLVHWHARGQDVAPLLDMLAEVEGTEDIRTSWEAYMASPYAAWPERCWSEQTLRVTVAGLRVMARYDRVVRHDDGRWTIFDWKTGRHFDAQGAERSWQTRLYRLALATGGQALNGGQPVAPEDISVVYWHVPSGEAHVFPYAEALRDEDEQALLAMGDRLRRGLADGFRANPHHCGRCQYQSRCQLSTERPARAESPWVWPTFNFPD